MRPTIFALALVLALAPEAAGQTAPWDVREPNRGGSIDLSTTDPEVALQRFTVADGYEVTLFASERDFPVEKPVAIAWDARGRLWVATMPTYPHYLPGSPPNDKLVILEDTNGDGRADKHTVFADSLYLPVGFELGDGGVYVSQQPNLMFLRDTNGDDVADERRVILHGFGTEDSHHSIHAFTWGPDGALYFQEGTFHHSQVETPHGPVRLYNAGVFRYEPRSEKLSVFVTYGFANPWGHAFDRWGQDMIADASNGNNYHALPISGYLEYPRKHPSMRVFTSVVRPTAGAEYVTSRHFPEEAQGNLLISNAIGFQGIKSHRVRFEGSGPVSEETPPLLQSSDLNFRPIDLEFGPDGALYLVDWFNPLVGHMQYSLRDPRRDREHGRIYRISAKGRPLLTPVDMTRLTVPQLLDQLKEYEDRSRYRARRELRERDRDEVLRELDRWVAQLDRADPEYQHHLLEALWLNQSLDRINHELLGRLLTSPDHRARAAATRVLRFWMDRVDDSLALLRRQVNDEHPLVRLEAVVALSYVPTAEAAEIALEALERPTDYYLDYGLRETIAALETHWKPLFTSGRPFAADNPAGILFLLDRLTPAEVAGVMRTETVNRELLVRRGIALPLRAEALRSLAASGRRSSAAVLLEAIGAVDDRPEPTGVGADLVALLADVPAGELRGVRAELESLARGASDARFRQGAYAALIRAEGSVERAWRLASSSPEGLVHLLAGARTLDDARLQAMLYPRVRDLLRAELARPTSAAGGVRGRYVRIEQPGNLQTLSLAEVEVMDGAVNVATGARAEQRSTASGGEAARAIDGDATSRFSLGSVTQSNRETDPWWEVDLGETRPIDAIRIWRRTDEGSRTGRVTVRVLDSERRPVVVREQVDSAGQPVVVPLGGEHALRRAAARALAAMPGQEGERVALFAEMLDRGVDRDIAIEGVRAALAGGWRGGEAGALSDRVLAYARSVPGSDRGGAGFRRAREVAGLLGGALPAPQSTRLAAGMDSLLVATVRLRAVPSAMRFDLPNFTVEAGREVELVFENPDEMPHNVVVTAPGAAERVGRAADAMSAQPDAFAKNFVPEMPEVLFATRLINHGETVTLRFRAPSAPGEYPFICSFPAHWLTMTGTMRVTAPAP